MAERDRSLCATRPGPAGGPQVRYYLPYGRVHRGRGERGPPSPARARYRRWSHRRRAPRPGLPPDRPGRVRYHVPMATLSEAADAADGGVSLLKTLRDQLISDLGTGLLSPTDTATYRRQLVSVTLELRKMEGYRATASGPPAAEHPGGPAGGNPIDQVAERRRKRLQAAGD